MLEAGGGNREDDGKERSGRDGPERGLPNLITVLADLSGSWHRPWSWHRPTSDRARRVAPRSLCSGTSGRRPTRWHRSSACAGPQARPVPA
eukprot:scaffold8079_cov267-Pinguiococcus_pyrenoidosus.AAC.1